MYLAQRKKVWTTKQVESPKKAKISEDHKRENEIQVKSVGLGVKIYPYCKLSNVSNSIEGSVDCQQVARPKMSENERKSMQKSEI